AAVQAAPFPISFLQSVSGLAIFSNEYSDTWLMPGPPTGSCLLALLWQISGVTGDFGFPNQFCSDSWVVGFWRADHDWQDIGLEERA
ncbi:MAG: hypothetical protein WB525_20445, partial [Pseudolabrys sp.]